MGELWFQDCLESPKVDIRGSRTVDGRNIGWYDSGLMLILSTQSFIALVR